MKINRRDCDGKFSAVFELLVLRCSIGLALSIGLFAQGGGRGSGIGTLPGNPTDPTRPGMPPQPGQPDVSVPDIRPVFLSGKVVMEDGTPPPEFVAIQLVCRATQRSVGYTDPKGGFAVDVNDRRNAATFADASEDLNSFGGNTARPNSALNPNACSCPDRWNPDRRDLWRQTPSSAHLR